MKKPRLILKDDRGFDYEADTVTEENFDALLELVADHYGVRTDALDVTTVLRISKKVSAET